eukprot:273613-Prymnesium_polylepis.2
MRVALAGLNWQGKCNAYCVIADSRTPPRQTGLAPLRRGLTAGVAPFGVWTRGGFGENDILTA